MNELRYCAVHTCLYSLFANNLRAEGAKFLSEGLKGNTGLKELEYAAIQTSLC